MFGVRGRFWVGATAADAPPTSENVNPAAPNAGTAFVARFRFEACFCRGIVASSIAVKDDPNSNQLRDNRFQQLNSTPYKYATQDWLLSIVCSGYLQPEDFMLMNDFRERRLGKRREDERLVHIARASARLSPLSLDHGAR
jgi:hypothetical protein